VNRKVFLAVALLVCLSTVIAIGLRHANTQRRVAAEAVNAVINAHAKEISRLLLTMREAPADEVADAVYRELQRTPSTSLLTRRVVTVEKASGSSERRCVITSLQIPSGHRIIDSADLRNAAP
jgi:hypothetical protein